MGRVRLVFTVAMALALFGLSCSHHATSPPTAVSLPNSAPPSSGDLLGTFAVTLDNDGKMVVVPGSFRPSGEAPAFLPEMTQVDKDKLSALNERYSLLRTGCHAMMSGARLPVMFHEICGEMEWAMEVEMEMEDIGLSLLPDQESVCWFSFPRQVARCKDRAGNVWTPTETIFTPEQIAESNLRYLMNLANSQQN